mgnify:CR=1 FL=1
MARFIKREMPDLNKDGSSKVYYKMETYRNYSHDEFVKYMIRGGVGISASMVEAVLTQVTDKLADLLGMGYTVTIDAPLRALSLSSVSLILSSRAAC